MKRISTDNILPAVIIMAVLAAYVTSFRGVFLFDDYNAIFANQSVVGDHAVYSGHRWLVDLSFRLNRALSGNRAFTYHLANLLTHLCAALFLYGVTRRTTARVLSGGTRFRHAASMFAFAVALLWGVHPLTTQAVTYICQRYESMAGMFALAALYCFIRGCEGANARLWFDFSLLALFAGMGSKEVMAVMPVLLLLYDYVFCEKSIGVIARRRGLFHIASFMMLLVLLLYQFQLAAKQMLLAEGGQRLGDISPFMYLYTQAEVILHYVSISLWPRQLCLDYCLSEASMNISGMIAFACHLILLLWFMLGVAKRRWWGFVGVAFYAVLAPTSSVIPVADLAEEHRMYIPLVSVIVGLVWILYRISLKVHAVRELQNRTAIRMYIVPVLLLGTALGVMTASRNLDYRSETAMWQDVVAKRPDNLRARNDLAAALSEEGSIAEARAEYSEVISRVPASLRSRLDRGEAMVTGVFKKNTYEYAYYVACANLGTMYCNEMRDYDAAFYWYLRALRVAPFSPKVRSSAMNLMRAFGHQDHELDQALNEAIRDSISEARAE